MRRARLPHRIGLGGVPRERHGLRHPLPAGLENGDRLPAPIYTPAFKAPMGEHDENISFDRTVELVGAEHADQLRDLSLEVYERAARTRTGAA